MMELKKLSDEEITQVLNNLAANDAEYKKTLNDAKKKSEYLCMLDFLDKNISSLSKTVQEIKKSLELKDYDKAYSQTFKLIRLYESGTTCVRSLPFETGYGNYTMRYENGIKAADMCFNEDNGVLHITMPSLLPKRAINSQDLSYIRQTWYNAFYEQFQKGKFKVYEDAVAICIFQYYDELTAMRDDDNTESKVLVDLIATFSLIDDNPNWCSKFFHSFKSDYNHTEIFVVPKSQFISFLQSQGF